MTEPTHAVVATFEVDLARREDQQAGLERFIVPSVRSAPGFVTGYWTLDTDEAVSVVFITFASEDTAQALRDNVTANTEAQTGVGLRLRSIRVTAIQARA